MELTILEYIKIQLIFAKSWIVDFIWTHAFILRYIFEFINNIYYHLQIQHCIIFELRENIHKCMLLSIEMNNLNYTKQLHELGTKSYELDDAMSIAILSGHLEIIKYLNKYIELSPYHAFNAALRGQLKIIKYCFDKYPQYLFNICNGATYNDSVEIIEYVYKKVSLNSDDIKQYNHNLFILACENDALNIIKYLHENKIINIYEEDNYGTYYALINNKFDIYRYLCEQGAKNIIKWAVQH
jgi:hypothetical protein